MYIMSIDLNSLVSHAKTAGALQPNKCYNYSMNKCDCKQCDCVDNKCPSCDCVSCTQNHDQSGYSELTEQEKLAVKLAI